MGRPKKERAPLPPIWRAPDALWVEVEPILAELDPPKQGPARIDQRAALDAMIFRVRSGCQWNRLPERFGDDATVHRWFQRFVKDGVLEELWTVLLSECEELGGVDWSWQAADGCMGKARFGGGKRGRIPLIEANLAARRA